MNKDIYKEVMDDINVDQKIIDKTMQRITNDTINMKHIATKCCITIIACVLIAMISILTYRKIPIFNQNKGVNRVVKKNTTNAVLPQLKDNKSNEILPQIKDNYVAFNGSESSNSMKYDFPVPPLSYHQLKSGSNSVIICTIKDIGIYRRKTEDINPKVEFGTYIYTVSIDKILSGNIDEKGGSIIPVSEMAMVGLVYDKNGGKTGEVHCTPYTPRADETRNLEKEKQYVMFLSNKDETNCYQLSYCGFGIFPIEYINKISKTYSLDELKNKYNYVEEESREPFKDNNFYNVCSLEVKQEFLK